MLSKKNYLLISISYSISKIKMYTNQTHKNQVHVVATWVHVFMSELCLTVKQNKADLSFSTDYQKS